MKPSPRQTPSLTPHFFAALGARIVAMQAEGLDVIRLDEGSPDLPPPDHIIAALARSAANPSSHAYQPHRGTPDLRSAWAHMYHQAFHVDLDPETEVLPLLGSKEGIFHLSLAALHTGDIVLIPDPGYITYTRGAQLAGAEPYFFPLMPEIGYLPDLDSIPQKILRRARLLWLNYPNNPTSATASLEFFHHAVDFAHQHELLLCHDAAYTQVTFQDHPAPSILQVPGAKVVAVEFNSLSKSHNMAGWRVGALLGKPDILRTLLTLKTNADSGQFLPILDGAVAAMTGDQSWLQERNQIYQERRDIVVAGLRSLGLEPEVPQAAIYVWSPIPEKARSEAFCQAVLETAHVSLTPGTVFGANGEGFMRISLTAPALRIAEAMQRLAESRDRLFS